jgi:hypothetical protein
MIKDQIAILRLLFGPGADASAFADGFVECWAVVAMSCPPISARRVFLDLHFDR